MSVFKDIKKWLTDRKERKEVDDMARLLNNPTMLYYSGALSEPDFVGNVAKYFSAMYNDLHFSNFDEAKYQRYNDWVTEWTNNFIEAEEMRLDDVNRLLGIIEKQFAERGVDIEKSLYKDNFGQGLTDLINNAHLIKQNGDEYNKLDYHSYVLLEHTIKGEMSLIQTLAQAISSGKLRRDGMPFTKGEVVALNLDDFEEYENQLDTFVERINLPKNPTEAQLKKAMDAYENYCGESFSVEDFEDYGE